LEYQITPIPGLSTHSGAMQQLMVSVFLRFLPPASVIQPDAKMK